MTFTSRYTKTEIRRVGFLDRFEKCSWLIKAEKDAPGWKIYTPKDVLINPSYDMHYVEYDHNVIKRTSSNFIKFDDQTNANKVYGTFYDKENSIEVHYPPVYQIVNPSDATLS